jgi:hypothetical protein
MIKEWRDIRSSCMRKNILLILGKMGNRKKMVSKNMRRKNYNIIKIQRTKKRIKNITKKNTPN